MMDFNTCASFVLRVEAGLTMNKKDKGNWTGGIVGKGELKGTNRGISAASYPDEDIKGMTKERALFLFKRDFWDKFKCDSIPKEIRLHYFDVCINSNGPRAIKILQRAAGFTGKDVDGDLGPKTLKAMSRVTIYRYARERTDFYVVIALADIANMGGFLAGWIGRVLEVNEKSDYLLSI